MNVPVPIDVRGVSKRFGASRCSDVDLRVEPGGIVALLGSSGCGKTTLLRIIAGLERLDAGEVRSATGCCPAPRHARPPEKRRVGMVFQDWALFPHLTVAQNVGYGLPKRERRGPRSAAALQLVGPRRAGRSQAGHLSGGQQQRVALARALAPQPGCLLLDEPFSNLDSTLRVQVRTEVHQLLADLGVTTVFVTHDQEEAFVLGDEVAVMQAGRIVQQARPPSSTPGRPVPWVATFVGDANLVAGDGRGDHAVTPVGDVALDVSEAEARQGPGRGRAAGRAAAPRPARRPHAHGGRGVPATVQLTEYYGHDTVYLVRPDGAEPVRARAAATPRFGRGDRVLVTYEGRQRWCSRPRPRGRTRRRGPRR